MVPNGAYLPLVAHCLYPGGEGYHNYHHAFPYDYSCSEWGVLFNPTTMFLDTMARLGLARDLKTATAATVAARTERTGKSEEGKRSVRKIVRNNNNE